jgi:hypothetical protein
VRQIFDENNKSNSWRSSCHVIGGKCSDGPTGRVQATFASGTKLQVNGKILPLKPAVNGVYELPLVKGDEALLLTGGKPTPVAVKPVPVAPEDCNPFGD